MLPQDSLDDLTAREREVLDLVRLGLTNEEIASRLGITEAGAKYHVSQILSKLGVTTREEAAAVAFAPRRRWWAALPLAAKAAGVAVMVAAVGGLGLLAWGVVLTSGSLDGSEQSNRVVDAGPVTDYDLRQPRHTTVADGTGLWVVRFGESAFLALSDTDTGRWATPDCAIVWRPDVHINDRAGWFRGKCSGSNFDLDGTHVSGPSPTDMHRLRVGIENGRVRVDILSFCAPPNNRLTEPCSLPPRPTVGR